MAQPAVLTTLESVCEDGHLDGGQGGIVYVWADTSGELAGAWSVGWYLAGTHALPHLAVVPPRQPPGYVASRVGPPGGPLNQCLNAGTWVLPAQPQFPSEGVWTCAS